MAIEQLKTTDGILNYPDADNPSYGTTEQQFQEWLKNQNSVLSDVVKATIWQPSAEYRTGQIIGSPNLIPNVVAKVTTAGITGTSEPLWSSVGVGETISDGSVTYVLVPQTLETASKDDVDTGTEQYKVITPAVMADLLKDIYKQAKLDAHPVGSIYESTDSTSPADLFGGTWEAMDPGRVLVSAGTAATGTVFTAGATGGEEKHQLTESENGPHTHSANCSTNGAHTHSLMFSWQSEAGSSKAPVYLQDTGDGSGSAGRSSNGVSVEGNHNHTITISSSGEGKPHNNMMPYETVYRWKRTA